MNKPLQNLRMNNNKLLQRPKSKSYIKKQILKEGPTSMSRFNNFNNINKVGSINLHQNGNGNSNFSALPKIASNEEKANMADANKSKGLMNSFKLKQDFTKNLELKSNLKINLTPRNKAEVNNVIGLHENNNSSNFSNIPETKLNPLFKSSESYKLVTLLNSRDFSPEKNRNENENVLEALKRKNKLLNLKNSNNIINQQNSKSNSDNISFNNFNQDSKENSKLSPIINKTNSQSKLIGKSNESLDKMKLALKDKEKIIKSSKFKSMSVISPQILKENNNIYFEDNILNSHCMVFKKWLDIEDVSF